MSTHTAKTKFSFFYTLSTHLTIAALISLVQSHGALAATAPNLGSTSTFGIVSSTFTNNVNPTVINGSVCYTTGPTTPATTITGATLTPCDTQIVDQNAALANLDLQLSSCVSLGAAVDLSSAVVNSGTPGVIPPGCYTSTGAMTIGSAVTLNGSGIYIFRPGAGASAAALTTAVNSQVNLIGACANEVFWAPVSATTLGANSTFVGTIIDAAGITLGNGATLQGRALSSGETVTTTANTITVPSVCSTPTLPKVTLSKVSIGGVGTFAFTGNNGFVNQSITTQTAGASEATAVQTLASAATITTIVESTPPEGYTLSSISCSGLGAGGNAAVDIPNRSVTLDAAATASGSALACTFTNTTNAVALGATSVPTLSEWALIMLSVLMAVSTYATMRKISHRSYRVTNEDVD